MKKRVFIIHGWDGNPNETWLKWLKEELRKQNFEVVAPQMPNAEEPRIEEWVPFLSDLVGEPNQETYFVGHSIGCQTIMRYLETIYPKKIGKIIFVAGWFNLENLEDKESEEIAKPWVETPIDFGKVKDTAENINVFLSDNDPWVPLTDEEIFEEKLEAKVILEKNKGHFTGDDNVNEIPEILEILRG